MFIKKYFHINAIECYIYSTITIMETITQKINNYFNEIDNENYTIICIKKSIKMEGMPGSYYLWEIHMINSTRVKVENKPNILIDYFHRLLS